MQLKAVFHVMQHSRFLFKHPLVLLRIFGELFRTIVFRQTRLQTVEWVINIECNSKCIMCYATKYHEPNQTYLSVEEIGSAWRECEKQGAFISILEGGEPTLRKDIDEIIKVMNPRRNIIVLVSNSLTLTEALIKHYKENGVSVLHLSLDGATAEINDRIRGCPGHFDTAMQCVQWAKKHGLSVYFSSVLKHSNKKEYEDIAKLAQRLRVGISGALLVAQGKFEERTDERLTEEDRNWLLDYFLKRYASAVRFDWNITLNGRYECPAGRGKVSISPYGEVMACVCNHLSFGNIRKEPVNIILKRMNNFSFFKEKNERCLVGFDTAYRKKYMDTTRDTQKLPVNIFEHPTHPAQLVNQKMVE